ncbi:MAG TPA: hypothetical protein VKZ50_16450 [bacterium]|nr:hypothetical protein [bacterium]
MRRDQRQTGSTRNAKPRKIDLVSQMVAPGAQAGPFPWDRSLGEVKKPSGRTLRRSFGADLRPKH